MGTHTYTPSSDGGRSCHHGSLCRGCGTSGQSTSASALITNPLTSRPFMALPFCQEITHSAVLKKTKKSFETTRDQIREARMLCWSRPVPGLSLVPRKRRLCVESRHTPSGWERTAEFHPAGHAAEVTFVATWSSSMFLILKGLICGLGKTGLSVSIPETGGSAPSLPSP